MSLDERREAVKKRGVCWTCLRQGHQAKSCRVFVKCLICSRKHYVLFCPQVNETKEKSLSTTTAFAAGVTESYLQTLFVKVEGVPVRAILDSGSQRSYIAESLIRKVGVQPVGAENLVQCLFGGKTAPLAKHNRYEFRVEALDGGFHFEVSALATNEICQAVPQLQDKELLQELRDRGVVLSDAGPNPPSRVELLLGVDALTKIQTGAMEVFSCGLVAVKSKLGWTVMGQTNIRKTTAFISVCLNNHVLPDLWQLDTLGIRDSPETVQTAALEAETIHFFQETIQRKADGRYEVALPWLTGHPPIDNNFDVARKRLAAATTRLTKQNRFEEYDHVFTDWEKEGIIEKVTSVNPAAEGHYLPHRPVYKSTSVTTRVRPVFDASCKRPDGTSLNDCLSKGPNMIKTIPPLLVDFRKEEVGVTADVKKAFLQIWVRDSDRDSLRFLWWKDKAMKEVAVYRHCRVPFGVSSSPFLLNATVDYHLKSANVVHGDCADTASKLRQAMYVDDVVTSCARADLEKLMDESSKLLALAGMELRGWKHTGMEVSEPAHLVLGVKWDIKKDLLYCNFEPTKEVLQSATKRQLLSLANRMYDPIGFCTPVTLVPKLLLQSAWQLKLGWEDTLPAHLLKPLKAWLRQVSALDKCRVPRWLRIDGECSVHVFCDASNAAYAACIFLRAVVQGDVYVQFVAAKARVAPLQRCTVPRLELLAAVIGVRLWWSLKDKFPSSVRVSFWSDSMATLWWIKRDEAWNTFVGNRVREIRQKSNPQDWRHVPGDRNPADLGSRGCSAEMLHESKWWEGPEWLKTPEEHWPRNALLCSDDVQQERRKTVQVMLSLSLGSSTLLDSLDRFSRYLKSLRVWTYVLRFVNNTRKPTKQFRGALTTEEVKVAETKMFKLLQAGTAEQLDSVCKDVELLTDSDGLLRVKSRLVMGDHESDFQTPLVLPSKHSLVRKLIHHQHETLLHAGVGTTLAKLRERFWLPQGRKAVRSVVSACLVCRRFKASRMETAPAPLPRDRIALGKAFQVVGVDLAGPLYLKDGTKTWVCLFTCAVYRAVHLELVGGPSTEQFLKAFRRFIARRGRVTTVYSDNGTNFTGASNLFRQEAVNNFAVDQGIEWKFNPPAAPWWGGWWERMVRLVKELLRRNLGRARLTYDELHTVLCDVEATINERPLTYMFDQASELRPVCPNMFLIDSEDTKTDQVDEVERSGLVGQLKRLQTHRDQLRQRFKSEYLGALAHLGKGKRASQISEGDVVLVEVDGLKRVQWPLGRVLKVFEGKDGGKRVAKIKTQCGELTRPLQRLVPLEMSGSFGVRSSPVTELMGDSEVTCPLEPTVEESVAEGSGVQSMRRSGRARRAPEKLDL